MILDQFPFDGLEAASENPVFEALVNEVLSIDDVSFVDAIVDEISLFVVAGGDPGVSLSESVHGQNGDGVPPFASVETVIALLSDAAGSVFLFGLFFFARVWVFEFGAVVEIGEDVAHGVSAAGEDACDIADVDAEFGIVLAVVVRIFAFFEMVFVFLDVAACDGSALYFEFVFFLLAVVEAAPGESRFCLGLLRESIFLDLAESDWAGASFAAITFCFGTSLVGGLCIFEITDICGSGGWVLGSFAVEAFWADFLGEFWALGFVELTVPLPDAHHVCSDSGDVDDLFLSRGLFVFEE